MSLKKEMKQYLKSKFKGLEDVESKDFDFDMEAAIYWFANDYHGGQTSELYSILSTSKFNPGPSHRSVKDEGDTAEMMYEELEKKYKNLKTAGVIMAKKKEKTWPKHLQKGRFTTYCKDQGFDGPCVECAQKALKSNDPSVRGMATFYLNTTKKRASVADHVRYLSVTAASEKVSLNDVPDKVKKVLKDKTGIDIIKKEQSRYTTTYTFVYKKGNHIVSLKTNPIVTVGGDNLIISVAD